jgi:hypothetical protein
VTRSGAIATALLTTLAGCAGTDWHAPRIYHCGTSPPGSPGGLTTLATILEGAPPRFFRMRWESPARDSGLQFSIPPWSGALPAAPPDAALASVSFRVSGARAGGPFRLELRAGTGGRAFSRSRAEADPRFFLITIRWDRLKAAAANGPIEGAVIDRQGRVVATGTIPPALVEAPAAAAAAERSRWDGVTGTAKRECPAGTELMQTVRVTG